MKENHFERLCQIGFRFVHNYFDTTPDNKKDLCNKKDQESKETTSDNSVQVEYQRSTNEKEEESSKKKKNVGRLLKYQ